MKIRSLRILVFFLLLIPAGLSAQSSDSVYENEWRMFHYQLNHSGFTQSSAPKAANLAWSYKTGGEVYSPPTAADGIVYAGSYDNKMYALNMSTGALVWSYETGNEILTSPAIANGMVYFGSQDGGFYALNASTGSLKWNYSTAAVVGLSYPAVSEGVAYFGSADNRVYALNATNGTQKWNYSVKSAGPPTAPAIAGGKVYFGGHNNESVYALNATTGAHIWNHSLGTSVYSSPAVSVENNLLYITARYNGVYALNLTDGSQEWNYDPGTDDFQPSSPALAYGRVYVGSMSGKFYALNATTGEHVWNYSSGAVSSSPAVSGGVVYFGGGSRLYALNATDGTYVWNYTTGASIGQSSPAIADGMLFIGSSDHKIYAFGPAPPWDGNLTGQLNVSQTCGSEINATALNFGSLVPGQTSSQQSLLLRNIGSWDTSDITIQGTDWIASATVNFTANYTKWSNVTGFSYGDGTSASNTPESLYFNLANNQTQDLFFRVQIPLAQATATYTQNITLTTIC